MVTKPIDLAQMMLSRIKEEPELTEYLRVSEIPMSEDEISLAELFYHMDVYYNKAATMKSALEFLTENVGLGKEYCILILAIPNDNLYQTVASVIRDETEGFLTARVKSLKDAMNLSNYFTLGHWSCGLITEEELPDGHCRELVSICRDRPVCVIGSFLSTIDYIKLLGIGANVIIETLETKGNLEERVGIALVEMFLE